MTRETQTPRVDAEVVRFARIMIEWPDPTGKADWGAKTTELVSADFARQLERRCQELEQALRAFLVLRTDFPGFVRDFSIATARADAALSQREGR